MMGRKVRGASALSLAAMAGIAFFGFEGSRAHAEMSEMVTLLPQAQIDAAPAIDLANAAITATTGTSNAGVPKTTFVSQPVVQTVPEPQEPQDAELVPSTGNLRDYLAGLAEPAQLDAQLQCLAGAIYFESKGEPLDGQLAVGRVIVARANSSRFPSSYCGVVYQRKQFSFVRGRTMPRINKASRAWKRAKKMALVADGNRWQSVSEGALYFHARYVNPRWSKRMTRVAQIDNHIFYR